MKYENREKAIQLCNRITKLEETLKDFDAPYLEVKIQLENYHLMTIGIPSEHDHCQRAAIFVSLLRNDMANEIIDLKNQLEAL